MPFSTRERVAVSVFCDPHFLRPHTHGATANAREAGGLGRTVGGRGEADAVLEVRNAAAFGDAAARDEAGLLARGLRSGPAALVDADARKPRFARIDAHAWETHAWALALQLQAKLPLANNEHRASFPKSQAS